MPIVVGDLLLGCADTGLVTCFNARTGEVRFRTRLSKRAEGYTASPVSAGVLFFRTRGTLVVVAAKR
ncbi:MAG: hypothetical protein RLZZ15_3772 [Verrucomicrobiota bacterium]|jgi:outer membrane protein assembly factor BamB